VLNYAIAMLRIGLPVVISVLFILIVGAARAQQATPTPALTSTASQDASTPSPSVTPELTILSPVSGQALQGSVSIEGSSLASGFVSAEVAFAYAGDSTGTWFLIAEASQPVQGGLLAQWDTGAITDGDYDLRLRITLADGSHVETVVSGLRVRNYTPIETDTPTPVTPTLTQLPGETPTLTLTPTALPSSTPLPPNPAEVSSQDILLSLGKGALAILGLFALLGVYMLVRNLGDRS
jgi:hypothetical protein